MVIFLNRPWGVKAIYLECIFRVDPPPGHPLLDKNVDFNDNNSHNKLLAKLTSGKRYHQKTFFDTFNGCLAVSEYHSV